ncbi:hypothetical protein B566_EDAN008712 [Ephemera danica]|nr:hypothetical protein B566_EDAN008712 [Ephemera danica]
MKTISIMNSLIPVLLIVVSAVVAEKNGGSGNNIYITIMDGKESSDDEKVMMKPPSSHVVLGDSMDDLAQFRDICLLGPIQKDRQNYCHASILRYTFDVSTGRCNKFIYGGCFGTENLFRTRRGEKKSDESSDTEEEDNDETVADISEN